MFDKEDSIYSMVHDGTALDDIYREIDKCQLLCASCHAVVTKVETQCGFIGLKRKLNRLYVDTTDDSRKDELKREYSSLYEAVMTTVYAIEIYNAPNSSNVSYRVVNEETGASAEGTISTDLPVSTIALTFFAARTMGGGGGLTGSGQFDLCKIGMYSI